MIALYRHIILLKILILFALASAAQEIPPLRSFDASELPGKSQNWMITQDDNGHIYVANSAGIMIYNGFRWKLIPLPNGSMVRSIFKSSDGCIYAGGYETFGFIDSGDSENIRYCSLSDEIPFEWIAQQDMWHTFEQEGTIYWQSFSTIYGFQSDSIFRIIPPTNIMFAQNVESSIIIPSIEKGLFELSKKKITLLSDLSDLPSGSRVSGVVNGNVRNDLIIGTQNKGLFLRKDGTYSQLQRSISEIVSADRLNRFMQLSDGSYALGTILNGLYILDDQLNIKYHLNKSNGLPNNTILALYEDKDQNLWIGMDKGISLLELDSPKKYYYDQNGLLGTIYAAALHDDTRYIGTNQGLFYLNDKHEYQLIPETQGQVWSLIQDQQHLVCGHNSGLFLINRQSGKQISSNTGVWDMETTAKGDILCSTYTGLALLKSNSQGELNYLRATNEPYLIKKFILEDNFLYGIHPQIGVYLISFDSTYTAVKEVTFLEKDQLPSVKLTDIKKIDANIYLRSEKKFYELNRDLRTVSPTQLSLTEWLQIKDTQIVKDEIENTEAIAIKNSPKSEILPYLFQESEGYFLLEPTNLKQRGIVLEVVGLTSKNKPIISSKPIPAINNDLVIALSNNVPAFKGILPLEYSIDGYDSSWRTVPRDGLIQARNLDDGVYRLLIRQSSSPEKSHELMEFQIAPHWYESNIAFIGYFILVLTAIGFSFRQQKKRLDRIQRELKAEQNEKLLKAQMKSRNEQLEQEVKYKSKMLANNAMTLIQKNKMLLDLKVYLKRARDEQNTVEYEKIVKLINRNIKSDEDWEIFEKNFAEVHDAFLSSFKQKHPSLTSGELRLAAYIRMNLSSKEIAPLLNISVRSVENKRHRLRKKIEIASSESLNEYLMRF